MAPDAMPVQMIAHRPMGLSVPEQTIVHHSREKMLPDVRLAQTISRRLCYIPSNGCRRTTVKSLTGRPSDRTEVYYPSYGLLMIERGPGPIALRTLRADRWNIRAAGLTVHQL